MKYFVIHSGLDYDVVKEKLIRLQEETPEVEYILLDYKHKDCWEKTAEKEIAESNKVIVFVNKKTRITVNIRSELEHVSKNNKDIYIFELKKRCKISKEILYGKENDFNSKNKNRINGKVFSNIDDLVFCIKSDLSSGLFNSKDDISSIMQQYSMFVKTSEDLVKRKQTINNLYITINSAILGLIITIAGLKLETGIFFVLKIMNFVLELSIKPVAVVIVAVFGILVCCSWITMLKIYANLNSSKMSVIIDIEKSLPLNLFESEWERVILKNKKRKYISFSKMETFIAILFVVFYLCIIFGGLFLIARQYF